MYTIHININVHQNIFTHLSPHRRHQHHVICKETRAHELAHELAQPPAAWLNSDTPGVYTRTRTGKSRYRTGKSRYQMGHKDPYSPHIGTLFTTYRNPIHHIQEPYSPHIGTLNRPGSSI